MLNQNEITQQIFDSISIIVENRLAGLNYDKTIICTIVDNSNAKNNIYTVTDGSIKFEANGQGNKYNINDSVRVEIPSGDWKQTKYIQGKHSTENDLKPVTYVSPIDSIVKLTNNLMPDLSSDYLKRSLRANQGPDLSKPTELKLGDITPNEDMKNADIFNSIYVQADFQTDLDQYQIRSGDYGLLLELNSVEGGKRQALKFSAIQDMFGNPYAFKIYTTQAKTYELSSANWAEGISSINVYLYEDNNFTYYDDNTQTVKMLDSEGINNIKVQNVIIGFGSQIYKIPDNSIKIYTDNTNTFKVENKNPEVAETKQLKLLWYNKTEDNEYVGFSDGKASNFSDGKLYSDYDEIAYRQLVKKDTRLLNQKSDEYYDDELSLSIAADRVDINKLAKSSARVIQGELYRELRGLYKWTKNMFEEDEDENDTIIDEMLDEKGIAEELESLPKLAISLENNADALSDYYLTALKAAKENKTLDNKINDIHNGIIIPIQTVFTLFGYNYSESELVLNTITNGSNVFPSLRKLIDEQYRSYEDIYISYKTRIDVLLKDLFNNYNKINEYLNDNSIQLVSLISGHYTPQAPYTKNSETEEYNNRYCIYWYRQNLTHTDPDNILPPGWERMTDQNNKGIPKPQDGGEYLQARADAEPCKVIFNRYVQKEIVKAVLFYNHERFESNELEFLNTATVEDTTIIDKNGALYIEHWNSTEGKDSHSKDSYQLYDANGLLINAAESQYQRELRVRFDGESGEDEQLIGATVYWYVPKNATLLDVFDSEVKDFYTDRVKEYSSLSLFKNTCKRDLISNYASYLVKVNIGEDNGENLPAEIDWRTYVVSTEFNNYEKNYLFINQLQGDTSTDKTKKYLVQDEANPLIYNEYEYDENVERKWKATGATINRFIATSHGKDKPDDIEARLANQSIYKPGYSCYYKTIGAKIKNKPEDVDDVKVEDTIFIYHIKDYYNQTFTQNTIFCQVIKNDNIYYADKIFTFSSFGNSGTGYTLTLLPDPQQNVITLDNPLDVNVALYDYNNNKIDIPLGLNVAFKWKGPDGYGGSDGLKGLHIDSSNNITGVEIKIPDPDKHNIYAGILECTINNIEIEQLNNKKINLTSYLPIAYSDSLNSYIEGTTMVIYDSQGGNPYYYKTPYKLFNALQNTEINNVSWSIEYYDSKGVSITFDENTSKFTKTSLVSLTSDNMLSVPLMYIPQEIYPVVIAKRNDTVLWAQPILITQNRYSSPMLNDWDGRLEIDEEDNTIMTMMIGAGRKNSNNQFNGVLMGDVKTGTGDDATATGLYGFHEGAQSFGFKIDGTAFLGKADHGRIEFNGNTGVIYSQNWLTSTGLTANGKYTPFDEDGNLKTGTVGMAIDLQNGHIDAYNFKLTSGEFTLSNAHISPSGVDMMDWYDDHVPTPEDKNEEKGKIIFKANDLFAVTNNGYLFAKDGYFTGIIRALGGTVGGWYIETDYLQSTLGNTKLYGGDGSNPDAPKMQSLVNNNTTSTIRFNTSTVEKHETVQLDILQGTGSTLTEFTLPANQGYTINSINCDNNFTYYYNLKVTRSHASTNKTELTTYIQLSPQMIRNDSVIVNCTLLTSGGDTEPEYNWEFDSEEGILYINNFIVDKWPTGVMEQNYEIEIKYQYNTSVLDEINYQAEGNTIIFSHANLTEDDHHGAGILTIDYTYNQPMFTVLEDGSLYTNALEANNATIAGKIFASSGKIGSWNIYSNGLLGAESIITSTNAEGTIINEIYGVGLDARQKEIEANNRLFAIGKMPDGILGPWGEAAFWIKADGTVHCANLEATGGTIRIEDEDDKWVEMGGKGGFRVVDTEFDDGPAACAQYSAYKIRFGTAPTQQNAKDGDNITNSHEITCYASLGLGSDYLNIRGPIHFEAGPINFYDKVRFHETVYNQGGGTIHNSYREAKYDIETLPDKYSILFDWLKPVRFKYKNGTSQRYHSGFIVDEVAQAMSQSNITSQEFAAYCIEDESTGVGGLRYDEFISLNTWQIQKLKPRMSEAEERIYKLEQELKELKAQLL